MSSIDQPTIGHSVFFYFAANRYSVDTFSASSSVIRTYIIVAADCYGSGRKCINNLCATAMSAVFGVDFASLFTAYRQFEASISGRRCFSGENHYITPLTNQYQWFTQQPLLDVRSTGFELMWNLNRQRTNVPKKSPYNSVRALSTKYCVLYVHRPLYLHQQLLLSAINK